MFNLDSWGLIKIKAFVLIPAMYLKTIAKADKVDGCLTKVLMHFLEIQTYPDVIQSLSWRDGNNWIKFICSPASFL